MSKCYQCGAEFTLKNEEIKCDSCHRKVNFICHECKEWFSIWNEKKECKLKGCGFCGFFICPNCKVCGYDCQREDIKNKIKEIIGETITTNQVEKIIELIEEIKIGKEQRCCSQGVPISYAKNRIKSCIVKMKGYRVKDEEDMKIFNQRIENVMDKNIGEILTVNQSREKGSYGQEFRDIFNYCICEGLLRKIKIKKIIDGEEIELIVYKRVEENACPMLDLKNLIIKVCTNPKCEIKNFPLNEIHCCDPRCNYKKGNKKGQSRLLKIKISNKDVCQLNRGLFKKEEDAKSKYY